MIEFQGVSKSYVSESGETLHALRDLDLRIESGETLSLIGASGCGKTTTLRLLNRLIEPSGGRILLKGTDTSQIDPVALRRGMGYVVQSGGLFPHLTIARNVGLMGELEGWDAGRIRERVTELLELVALPAASFEDRFPCELSGGQRQRVCIARALLLDPGVLLMDEPFGALDPITRAEVRTELKDVARGSQRTVVLVTHDLDEAFELGDRVGLLVDGRLEQLGELEAFRDDPASEYVAQFVRKHLHGS